MDVKSLHVACHSVLTKPHFAPGRHIASTKMNATSSRSHLIIGIVIESTNLTTGAVVQGKLSLVDLAG